MDARENGARWHHGPQVGPTGPTVGRLRGWGGRLVYRSISMDHDDDAVIDALVAWVGSA